MAALLDNVHLKDLFRVFSLSLTVKVLAAAVSFLLNVLIARELGIEEAGYFFMGLTLLTIFSALSRLGLDNTLVKLVAESESNGEWGRVHSLLKKALWISFVSSSTVASLTFLFNTQLSHFFFLSESFSAVLVWVSAATVIHALLFIVTMTLQGLRKAYLSIFYQAVFSQAILCVLLLSLDYHAAWQIFYHFMLAFAFALVVLVLVWRKVAVKPTRNLSVPYNEIAEHTKPLFFVQLFTLIDAWSCQVILGVYANSDDVALFAVAQRITFLISFVLVAVNSIAAPKFAALYSAGDTLEFRRMISWSSRFSLIAGVPLLIIVVLFSKQILAVFGEEYIAASLPLVIIACAQLVNVATGAVGNLLMMTGNASRHRNNVMLATSISLLVSMLVIPQYGVVGASACFAFAMVLSNLLSWWRVRQILGINTLRLIFNYR